MTSKKGQSQIIVTILIILLVLASVVIVWNVVNNTIRNSSDEVEIGKFVAQIKLEKISLPITGGIEVKLKVTKGSVDGLRFIFISEDEDPITIEKTKNLPSQLETKSFLFAADEIPSSISEITVIPILDEKLGLDVSTKKIDRIFVAPGDNSLISWWKFENTATDSEGDNHGRLVNNPKIVNGAVGKAYYFDGTSALSHISVKHDSSLEIQDNMSISMWININGWDTPYEEFIKKGNFRFETADYVLRSPGIPENLWIAGRNYDINWADDTWFHIVYVSTKSPSKTWVYINGFQNGTSGDNGLTDFSGLEDLRFGNLNAAQTFDGALDEIMIFNKALTIEEIKEIYNNQKP